MEASCWPGDLHFAVKQTSAGQAYQAPPEEVETNEMIEDNQWLDRALFTNEDTSLGDMNG